MDAVYILGSGSLANDEEILYSVRSLCENMEDLRNVYVIGNNPKHLPLVQHYQFEDSAPEGWKNVYHKVLKACSIEELSDEFLLMNDDFFLRAPFKAESYPFYTVKGANGGPCGQHSFQIHAPMRISKEHFPKMPFDVNQNACKSFRSFYGNFYGAPAKPVDDSVVRAGENVPSFDNQVAGMPFFSCSNTTFIHPDFNDWIKTKYPNACIFE